MPRCSRWRPSLATSANEITIETTMPAVIGTRVRPACTGEKPWPTWQNSDTIRIRPANTAKKPSATAMPSM